jgi:thiol-disulfide isomerase/thioredoxin
MMKLLVVLTALVIGLAGCEGDRKPVILKTGYWRAELTIQGQSLPFNFELNQATGGGYYADILNADERLRLDEVQLKDDSVIIGLHIFDATIKAHLDGDSLNGLFIKNYEKDYKIPFKAKYNQRFRFLKAETIDSIPDFNGKYAVTFIDTKDTTQAIGIFKQSKDSVTGTFLTPTGDYRYLQGNVDRGKMQLSTFDGNHTYLFSAIKNPDGTLTGEYFSGKTYYANWTGIKNENASLPDAESLTYLKKGFDRINFSFPDVLGNKISLNDKKYKGKVIILQMMGSWCPNCMDETKFLVPWYQQNKDRGVEIIGLAYERKDDFNYARERVKKMIEKLDIPYDVVIAGTNDKAKAAETLPMLNAVVAFPTTIFIGKDGKVKKIHTGFSGPGTGVYYQQFVEEFNETVNELLAAEKPYQEATSR